MQQESIVFSIFLIFTGAALLATVALFLRQAMLVAYLLLGVLLGPWGFALVTDAKLINDISHIGIIFLLFLLGLNLSPQKLVQLFRSTLLVTLITSLIFVGFATAVAWLFGFTGSDLVLIGVAAGFSSTIIGLKLLPTTVLHHRHTGEVIISVLLLQDLFAILVLVGVQGFGSNDLPLWRVVMLFVGLPILVAVASLGQRYILLPLLTRFDRIAEYVFLLAIGWCLGIAEFSMSMGLSYEVGAFIAGVAIASSPIASHIAETLKPLRDFFLVMFFFGLGASFNLGEIGHVLLPAVLIAGGLLILKPVVYRWALLTQSESNKLAWETGVRLGQISEFSLLIVFSAQVYGLLSDAAFALIQLATLLTFIVSAFVIVRYYPTPIALDERLRRD